MCYFSHWVIFNEKEKAFGFAYRDGQALYVVFGFGEQNTGGYSIQLAAVKENDASAVDALLPAVTELTKTFKDLFPKDIEDHWHPMIGM